MTSRPDWLYGQGCCEHWTPLGGCSSHTGRSAMSLLARTLDEEEWMRVHHGIEPQAAPPGREGTTGTVA